MVWHGEADEWLHYVIFCHAVILNYHFKEQIMCVVWQMRMWSVKLRLSGQDNADHFRNVCCCDTSSYSVWRQMTWKEVKNMLMKKYFNI